MSSVGARWFGVDWDVLSLKVSPNFALLNGVLVAIGFILPHVGPFLQERWIDRATYRHLQPLWKLLHTIDPSPVPVRMSRFAPLNLRLARRTRDIHDGLLLLAPHLDDQRRRLAYHAALEAGYPEDRARGIAGAVDIVAAVDLFQTATLPEDCEDAAPISSDLNSIEPISRALRSPSRVEAIGQLAANRRSSHTHG